MRFLQPFLNLLFAVRFSQMQILHDKNISNGIFLVLCGFDVYIINCLNSIIGHNDGIGGFSIITFYGYCSRNPVQCIFISCIILIVKS